MNNKKQKVHVHVERLPGTSFRANQSIVRELLSRINQNRTIRELTRYKCERSCRTSFVPHVLNQVVSDAVVSELGCIY